MIAIKAIVRDGRIETEEPLDLPEGTELLIAWPKVSEDESGWNNSPAGIAAWLHWYESLEPLIDDGHEETSADEWLKQCDRHESAKQNRDIKELFQ